jgi:multiple sugar transport system ATP-binding protein
MVRVLLKKVSKIYNNKTTIIKDLDLDINPGEFVVFVGPSGCGKSTLLRMIAGLEELSGGEIEIDDKLVSDLPPSKRSIAMVFQSYALYPHMNVYKNMAFSLKMAKVDTSEIEKKVQKVAEILQLDKLLKRLPKQLSGGQRQRVAIGRAIVRDPKVFLFDEPLSNLDASLRTQTRIEIERLHKKLGATMIYVTHDQLEAMTLADRVVVLNGGKIEQFDTPTNLYHKPKNLFVAGFMGALKMNFIKTTYNNGVVLR